MFDGRHCAKKDLDLLIKETDKIVSLISSDLSEDKKNKELDNFVNFIKRFDSEIADSLQNKIKDFKNDYSKIKTAIERHIEELKRNVIIDIYEH